MDYYLYLRETFINNFNVSIKAIKIKKFIIKNYYLLFCFRFFPFYFFKLLIHFLDKLNLNIQYVYMIDNIYFSNNMRQIEKWGYSQLENDQCKHITEFYKNKKK